MYFRYTLVTRTSTNYYLIISFLSSLTAVFVKVEDKEFIKNKFENEEKDSQTGNWGEGGGVAAVVVSWPIFWVKETTRHSQLSKSHAAATHSFVV